jgi:chitodextrinase
MSLPTIARSRTQWFVLLAAALALPFLSAVSTAAADRIRPTTPTNLRATAVTASSVALAWNPSTDNSGSLTYTVREVNSGQTRSVAQTPTTYTWTGLQAGRTYRFVVFARDAAGNQSSNSNTLTVSTPLPPPTAPANVRVTSVSYTSIALAWDAVPGASHYHVQVGSHLYSTLAAPSYTLNGLNPNSSYVVSVRMGGPSYGPWSTPITVATLTDAVPPSTPVVSGAALSPGVVRLAWTESFDAVSAVGYNVYVNGQPARSMLPDWNAPRSVVIHNLRAATSYEFTVRAYDAGGNFSPAVPLLLTTPAGTDTIPPAAPANLRPGGFSGPGNGISSVAVAWNGSADNVGTVAYEILLDGVLVGQTVWDVHYPGLDTWFIVRQIPPGTTHTITVRARDEAGNVSAPSNPLTVTMLPSTDTTPPTAPVILAGSTWPGCGFIDLTFGGATDNDPVGIEYEIYEDGIFRGIWREEAFEASFGRHEFYIRAVDRAGNRSAPSNVIVLDSGLDC